MKHFIKAIVIAAVTFLACWLMSLADIDEGGVVLIIWIGTMTLLDYVMEVVTKAFNSYLDERKMRKELIKKWLEES